ncbi:MAG: hypothetical protein ABI767_16915 [Rhodanobacter sp.]
MRIQGIALRDGLRRHRLAALRFAGGCTLLPSFVALTGLFETPPHTGERIVAFARPGPVPMDAASRGE